MTQQEGKLFYGWYLVAVCFVVNFVVFGISINTFTVYVKPIVTEMAWSRAKFSFGLTIAALTMAFLVPFVGWLIDKVGAKIMMTVGASIIGICTLLLTKAQTITEFYVLYGLSGAGQAATTIVPISVIISNWFDLKRGRALGVVMTGTGLGAMVMVPVTSWIVVTWGWRTSYFIMGWIILLMAPLSYIFVRTSPSEMGLKPDGGLIVQSETPELEGVTLIQALKSRSFWFLAVMMMMLGLVGMGLGFHMMPYLTDIGYTEIMAGLIISVISAMTVLGKIGMGIIADRWGVRRTVIFTCVLIIAGVLMLIRAEILFVVILFAIVYGLAIGAPLVINPALTADCFGLAFYGSIFGILSLFNVIGAGLGATLTGAIFDSAQSYIPAFWLFIVLTAIAGFCGVMARRIVVSSNSS